MLVEQLHAAQVVVGENFTYGHRAAGHGRDAGRRGPPVRLRRRGRAAGGGRGRRRRRDDLLDLHPRLRRRRRHGAGGPRARAARTGWTASSSAGTAGAGTLGYPTANVESPPYTAIPADGVYAGHLVTRDPRSGASRERLPGGDLGRHQPDVPGQPAHRRGVRAGLRRRPVRRARRRGVRRSGCARWRRFDRTSTACSMPPMAKDVSGHPRLRLPLGRSSGRPRCV